MVISNRATPETRQIYEAMHGLQAAEQGHNEHRTVLHAPHRGSATLSWRSHLFL